VSAVHTPNVEAGRVDVVVAVDVDADPDASVHR
jgi:hypothetical protein